MLKINFFGQSLREAVHASPFANLWLIPAASGLADLQAKLESRYKILKLKQALDELSALRGFDEVIIDTPPALNFYSMSALIAAERVLIPFDGDAFSAQALLQVAETVGEVREDYQPSLSVEGVVISHFQAQAKLPRQAIDSLASQGFTILSPYLSSSVVMKESHGQHKPLVFFRPKHKLAQEYLALADTLLAAGHVKCKKPKRQALPQADAPRV